MTLYLRHENLLASTDTTCDDELCARDGCQFPHCSKDFQSCASKAKADRLETQLRNLGHEVKHEPFGDENNG